MFYELKGDKLYLKIFCFFCLFIINFDLKAKGVVEIIRENPNFSTFYSYINNTELEATLQQQFPWNWTMFVPNNKAFDALPKKVYEQLLPINQFNYIKEKVCM